MTTRREILCAIGAVAAAIQATSTVKAELNLNCQEEAGKLAELMQITCGGQWRVSVDQNLEFILVQKVLT